MDVCIVGGGIGGLALARGLQREGHRVCVLERGDGPAVGGAAVSIYPNGAAALADFSIDLEDLGGYFDRLHTRSAEGRTVMRVDLTPVRRRTGFAIRAIPRAALITRLAEGLAPGTVRYGASVTAVRAGADGADVTLASGDTVRADVVVGADGYRSAVRRSVLDPAPAAEVGWDTWQGLGPVLPDVAAGTTGHILVGPAGMVGLLPSGNGLVQWWFDVRTAAAPCETSPASALRRAFADYADPVPELLTAVRDEDLGRYPHVVHRVRSRWGEGPVTLLGDAAHAFPPSQAQGANQAVEDAWLLTRALGPGGGSTPSHVPAALRAYERRRARRVRVVSRLAVAEHTNKVPPRALATLARATPPAVAGRLYGRLIRRFSSVLNRESP